MKCFTMRGAERRNSISSWVKIHNNRQEMEGLIAETCRLMDESEDEMIQLQAW
jgi:hypothetical protein